MIAALLRLFALNKPHSKSMVYYQESMPQSSKECKLERGDIWYNTTDGRYDYYTFNGKRWVLLARGFSV